MMARKRASCCSASGDSIISKSVIVRIFSDRLRIEDSRVLAVLDFEILYWKFYQG